VKRRLAQDTIDRGASPDGASHSIHLVDDSADDVVSAVYIERSKVLWRELLSARTC
jgi:hypothetical protein